MPTTRGSAKQNGNATNRNAKTTRKAPATTSKAKGKANATTSGASNKETESSSKRKRPAEALDEGMDKEKNVVDKVKKGKNAKAGASSSDKTSETPAQKKQRTDNSSGATEAAQKNAPTATNATTKSTAKPIQDANADVHATPTTPPFTGGAFDIYAMQLPFLQKALKPNGDYAALHAKILEYQAKPDNSGQIAISVPSDTSTNGYGRLSSGMFTEPMGDERYEIGLASLKRHTELKFTAKEKKLFFPEDADSIPKGEGISATLVLEEDMCTISGISGELKMSTTPVWKGAEETQVMYQGVVSFSARYSGMLARKGHGPGASLSVGLWLVPSKEMRKLNCDGAEHLANQIGSTVTQSFGGGGYGYDDDLDGWDEDEDSDDGYPYY
ncbi:hypothetical protein PQX77_011105 [Marasmius sp. AFHP31]|nr:hypothetical protein PQX77_011105 [Marasmius sp. AFHP31]